MSDEGDDLRAVNERIANRRATLAAAGRLVADHTPTTQDVPSAVVDARALKAVVSHAASLSTCDTDEHKARRGAFLGDAFASCIARGMDDVLRRCLSRNIDPEGDLAEALLCWEPNPKAWASLEAAMKRGMRLFLICGTMGCGKSSLAAHVVVWHRTPDDITATPFLISAARLAEALAMPYDDVRRRIKARAERTPAIAIDDFGRKAIPPEHMAALNDYLCTAVTRGVKVVITTNMTKEQLDPSLFFDPLLRDRSARYTHMISMNLPSRRQAPKAPRATRGAP